MTKYQIQIKIRNWVNGFSVINEEISLKDIKKFAHLAKMINKYHGKKVWNWFGYGKGLPDKLEGHYYVLDTNRLCEHMKDNFNYDVEDVDLIIEFYRKFTPYGCDGIDYVKFFKMNEITDF